MPSVTERGSKGKMNARVGPESVHGITDKKENNICKVCKLNITKADTNNTGA